MEIEFPKNCPFCQSITEELPAGRDCNVARMACPNCQFIDCYCFFATYICGALSTVHIIVDGLELELNYLGKNQFLHERKETLDVSGNPETEQNTISCMSYVSQIDLTSAQDIKDKIKLLATFI